MSREIKISDCMLSLLIGAVTKTSIVLSFKAVTADAKDLKHIHQIFVALPN